MVGFRMSPEPKAYTAAIPWYEREGFAKLAALADDREDGLADYETWHANASAVAERCLADGNALTFIWIDPEDALAWLFEHQLPNNFRTRLRYVEMLAFGAVGHTRFNKYLGW